MRQASSDSLPEPAFRIVLGVTGSIAAYKALELTRHLGGRGARVSVVLTRSAQELVRPRSFAALTRTRVFTDLFGRSEQTPAWQLAHIDLAQSAHLILIAPATANIIGKVAAGIADDLLSTLIMATGAPVLFAPAMNQRMWANPIVQANVARLKALGYSFVGPETGSLACGAEGPGRLAETEAIVAAAWNLIRPSTELVGYRVVVTAGATEEAIDPVRVVTNRSSGSMGIALAQACAAAGAQVTLVTGRVTVPLPTGVEVISVTTTEQMLAALKRLLPAADALIMAAAPADYRPFKQARNKLKDQSLKVQLQRTPDILSELRALRHRALMVGFALETSSLVENARRKLKTKGLDLIVANPVDTLHSDSIKPALIFPKGRVRSLPRQSKTEFARVLVQTLAPLLARVRG